MNRVELSSVTLCACFGADLQASAGLYIESGSVSCGIQAFQDAPRVGKTGEQFVRIKVPFSKAFTAPPVIQVNLKLMDVRVAPVDAPSGYCVRADVFASAADVTTTGFVVTFRTWDNTYVFELQANWLAIGNSTV